MVHSEYLIIIFKRRSLFLFLAFVFAVDHSIGSEQVGNASINWTSLRCVKKVIFKMCKTNEKCVRVRVLFLFWVGGVKFFYEPKGAQ